MILAFIDNEVCQMLSKVFAIVSLVTGALNIVGNFDKIIRSFATGLQGIGESLNSSAVWLGDMLKHGVSGFVTGMSTILSKAVTGICLNMSYNKALTTFGLNADLAGITSAFLSGGFTGVDKTFSLTGALSNFTLEGVRYAGRELGLDPTITSIIGTAASTIVSAGLGGVSYYDDKGVPQVLKGLEAISYTIGTTVLPNVASELAYYGITKLGEAIGIDSIVSQIAGIGIRSTISAGLRGYNADDWNKTAIGGLVQGVTSIGINYATQALGLNPLLANLGFSAIASALNAGIQAATGGSQDVFKTFFDTYINNALTFLGYGNVTDPNYAWLEASYKASILDFSDIVRDKGLVEALNTYGTSFFNSTTVGAIAQSGMTIGKYFEDKINRNEGTLRIYGDITYLDVPVEYNGIDVGSGFFIKEMNSDGSYNWVLVGKEEVYADHIFWGLGELGKDSYGNLALWKDATLMDTYNTFKTIEKIDANANLVSQQLMDADNNIITNTTSSSSNGITYNIDGSYIDAILNAVFAGYDIKLNGGLVEKYSSSYAYWFTDEQRAQLRLMGYSDNEIDMILSDIDLAVDKNGNPSLNYSLSSTAQKLFNISSAAGKAWLDLIKADIELFYAVGDKLWDEKYYTKNTNVLYNEIKGIGAVDMHLNVLDEFGCLKDTTTPLIGWLLLGWRLGNDNSIWDMAVKDAAPEITRLVDDVGLKFVYTPGNRYVANLAEVEKMRDLLGTDKKVVVSWSAGTEAVIRSWATTKDKNVYYILVSPRMAPETLASYAASAGIDASKILIINAKGDVADWGPGYGNNSSYEQSWAHVFLKADTTDFEDPMLGHSGPIDGWLNSHFYDIIIDGENLLNNKSLIEIYRKFLNGELLSYE